MVGQWPDTRFKSYSAQSEENQFLHPRGRDLKICGNVVLIARSLYLTAHHAEYTVNKNFPNSFFHLFLYNTNYTEQ